MKEKVIKTRKSHVCDFCDQEIPKGSEAVFISDRRPLISYQEETFDGEKPDGEQVGIDYLRSYFHIECNPKPSPEEEPDLDFDPLESYYKPRTIFDLDRTKIDYISSSNGSHCSMIKEGVFPPGTTQEEVRVHVDGSFGGHFHKWDEKKGEFYFIAYTD